MIGKTLIIGGCGYIGSALFRHLSRKSHIVDTLDWDPKGSEVNPDNICKDFGELSSLDLNAYKNIILLAGHSSVPQALADPYGAFDNNVVRFYKLLKVLRPDQLLIYASTSSLYNGSTRIEVTEEESLYKPSNIYDFSKFVIDGLVGQLGTNAIGLRFGTVNGSSPRFREDLMINRMVSAGLNRGYISVTNPDIHRPILALKDLMRAVELLLDSDITGPRIFNLASVNSTVDEIAQVVSTQLGVPISYEKNSNPYDFSMSCERFAQQFGFRFEQTLQSITTEVLDYLSHEKSNGQKEAKKAWTGIRECLCCGNSNLSVYLDLGRQPLANSYSHIEEILEHYPLAVQRCNICFHSQLTAAVNPDFLFRNYIYLSGTTSTLLKYFRDLVSRIESDFGSEGTLKVLDLACNDGSLMEAFNQRGHETWGVDPAENLYEMTRQRGLRVIRGYWGDEVSDSFTEKMHVITALNVVAHVRAPLEFLVAAKKTLSMSGRMYIQTSQSEMIRIGEFDTIYHEHHSFFTVRSMKMLAERAGMTLTHVEKVPIHGTSFIFTLMQDGTLGDASVTHHLNIEQHDGLYSEPTYDEFGRKVHNLIEETRSLVRTLESEGYEIVGYGAAAKGNTFLNFSGLPLKYIVDDNQLKWGTVTPGRNIPIVSPDMLANENGKLGIVLLAWNFRDEIIERIRNLRPSGNGDVAISYYPKVDMRLL